MLQVFDEIRAILMMTNVGFLLKETPAMIHIKINQLTKLRCLLRQASTLNFLEVTKNGLKAEITVSKATPFCISFSKKKEKVSVSFKYSWVNKYGVRQS